MYVTTDARGKILRQGCKVHPIHALRSIKKRVPNGRVLANLRSRVVKKITNYTHFEPCVCADGCLKCNGSMTVEVFDKSLVTIGKKDYPGSALIRE